MSIGNAPDDPNISASLKQWLERVRQELSKPRRPIYIPVTEFSGFLNDQFLGSGTPVLQEINSLCVVGARIEATGDSCHHLFFVPKDFNVDTNIKIEVVWCTNSVDVAETATWGVQYNAAAPGQALAAAGTPLNETIAADNVLGAYTVAVSPYGLLYKGALDHGDLVHLNVTLDAVQGLNPAVDQVFLLAILINDQG